MFNFLELLRLQGFGMGYLVLAILGVVLGFCGYWCAKKDKEEGGNNWWPWVGIFHICLSLEVCYFFTIPLSLEADFILGTIVSVIVVLVSSVAALLLFTYSISKVALIRSMDKIGRKLPFVGMSALFSILLALILSSNNVLFFSTLNQRQKAEWLIAEKILKFSCQKEIIKAQAKIKQYNYPPSPFLGIADLKLENMSGAANSFREYANTRLDKERYFWSGIADFYQGRFASASRNFELAQNYDLQLFALFKSGNLDQLKLKELKKKSSSGMMADIEKVMLLKEMAQKPVKKVGFEEWVLAKLKSLEERFESAHGDSSKKTISLEERINEKINAKIYALVLTRNKAPIPPETDNDKTTFLFMSSILPILFLIIFIVNAIMRDWAGKKVKGLSPKASALIKKLSWHSFYARKVVARIALSEKVKGMFSEEIGKIQNAVFPFDAFSSFFYLRKTKKILKVWEVNSQEKEDIRHIYSEIKMLSGKLIPQGNEKFLAVINALRSKALQTANACLKNDIDYQQGRESLLATLDELATVGDILDARNGNAITYYSFLGIRAGAKTEDLKKGYRSVMSAIHPDRHQGNPYLQTLATEVNAAYAVLSNSFKREIYDKQMGF